MSDTDRKADRDAKIVIAVLLALGALQLPRWIARRGWRQ